MFEKMIELQQKRRSKKGGFTLVELIVVLVILAILAALLIPALTGYIDKARDKQIIAETRQAVMAAQTLYDEAYGKGADATKVSKDLADLAKVFGTTAVDKSTNKVSSTGGLLNQGDVLDLAELNGRGEITAASVSGGKIATLTWKSYKNGKSCEYNASKGSYEVKDS